MEKEQSAPTCCEETPAAAGSGVQWRCVPAASASVCQEAACVRVAPGVTRPHPPGRQVVLTAPPLPEPPAGLGGRLDGESLNLKSPHVL